MIYLHTSALVRLVTPGDDDPLPELLAESGDGIAVSSELSRVELLAARLPPTVLRRAHAVLDAPAVLNVEVSDLIRDLAESLADDELDADQAVHLATALSLGAAVTVFACEDRALGAAAAARGMRAPVPPIGPDCNRRPPGGDCEAQC